jgi:hypothetical protein
VDKVHQEERVEDGISQDFNEIMLVLINNVELI